MISSSVALAILSLCEPKGPILSCPEATGSYALFEFAPASGAGMGAACACTTPTGAKGEVLTFSRASTGWCTKGNETTGIVNGDLVECASGQPRVMPGGGGSGGLGLSIWEARTNVLLRSAEFDNAAWIKFAAGGSIAPVVTADFAVAPDGTTTAERVQFAATSVITDNSSVYQQVVVAANVSVSLYVKGNGTSGTLAIGNFNGTTYVVTACVYNSSTWTRCLNENATNPGANGAMVVGNGSTFGGFATSYPAHDVLMWGGVMEEGATSGPYITTAGTAATRVAELADLALTFGAGTTGFSTAATYVSSVARYANQYPVTTAAGNRLPGVAAGSTSYSENYIDNANLLRCDVTASTPNTVDPFALVGATPGTLRMAVYNTGASLGQCIGGTCESESATWTPPAWLRVRVGNYDATNSNANGVIKKVCVDPDSARCR